jgi:hypothetical protein
MAVPGQPMAASEPGEKALLDLGYFARSDQKNTLASWHKLPNWLTTSDVHKSLRG